eukprot:351796-Chlamydomonas_euryale.AAC.3
MINLPFKVSTSMPPAESEIQSYRERTHEGYAFEERSKTQGITAGWAPLPPADVGHDHMAGVGEGGGSSALQRCINTATAVCEDSGTV